MFAVFLYAYFDLVFDHDILSIAKTVCIVNNSKLLVLGKSKNWTDDSGGDILG